jgi:hypothetical protein
MNHYTDTTPISDSYAEWMKARHWDHFATLTLESELSPRSVEQYIGQTFIRHLERVSQQRVDYYGTVERGAIHDRPHAHILLAGTKALTVDTIRDSWRRGFASVGIYDPTRNGVWYSGKSLALEDTVLLLRDLRTNH